MIYALEGLRGVAALAVALFHAWPSFFTAPFASSWLCVDLFFVISGYVMSHVYRLHLSTVDGLVGFGLKRFGRLYPLHLVTLAAFIGCMVAVQLAKPLAGLFGHAVNPVRLDVVEVWSLLQNALLLNGLPSFGERAYNAPSWSISTELWTYAVFALSAFLLRGRARIIAWAALSAAGLALWMSAPNEGNAVSSGAAFFRCLHGFFLGSLLPVLAATRKSRRVVRVQSLSAISALAVFWLVNRYDFLKFVAPAIFAALVFSLGQDRGPVAEVLHARPLQELGRLSYSVYMVHWPLLVLFNPLAQLLIEPYRSALAAVYLALLLLVSAATFRLIEDPWRKRFQRYAAKGALLKLPRLFNAQ